MSRIASGKYLLDSDARLLRGGEVVVGGQPVRVIRLAPAGVSILREAVGGGVVNLDPEGEGLLNRLVSAGVIHPHPDPVAGAGREVTVAIPARDEAGSIGSLVEALVPRVARVIVVDDGSRDETAQLASKAGATVIDHRESHGPAAARNTALKAASTDLIAFLDADCLPPPGDWLDRLIPLLDQPGVKLVAPRVVGAAVPAGAGVIAAAIAGHEQGGGPLDMGARPSLAGPGRPVSFLPSAAILARRQALVELGGFEESLRYGEDVDLVWRLTRTGGICRYEPSVVVEHRSRAGLPEFARQRFEYGRSAVALDRRHPGAVAPLQGAPAATLAALAVPVAGPLPLLGVAFRDGRRMTGVGAPLTSREAFGIGLNGGLATTRMVSRVLAREWLPLTLLAACSKRLRPVALLGVLGVLATEGRRKPRRLPRSLALGLLDRLSYSAGLWSAAITARNAGAILPCRRGTSRIRKPEGPESGPRPGPGRSPEPHSSVRS